MQAMQHRSLPVIGIADGQDSGSEGGMMERVPRPLIARAGAPSHVAVGGMIGGIVATGKRLTR